MEISHYLPYYNTERRYHALNYLAPITSKPIFKPRPNSLRRSWAISLRLASESRSTQAAAQQLGISPKLLYRWQQAQLIAEMGSVEVVRDPEVRQLRAQLKRAEQELDI